jgi:hypothetical protein
MYNLTALLNGAPIPLGTLTTLPDGKGGFTGSISSGAFSVAITASLIATATSTGTAAPVALSAISGTLPNGTVGSPYSAVLSVTGGKAPISWGMSGLPAGVSQINGTVSGTPSASGAFTVTANVADSSVPPQTTSNTYPISIAAAAALGPAPTNVSAIGWPYTTLVSFTPAVAPAGKTIVGYTASGVNAAWITGSAPASPICAHQDPSANNQFEVVANYSDGTTSAPSAASNTVSSQFASGTDSVSPYVYKGGVFYWQGDYDYSVETYYASTNGAPTDGPYCIEISSQGGGWLPYAPNNTYDATPYTHFNFDMKPTANGKQLQLLFYKIGDVAIGNPIPIASYGPAPVAGQWGTYSIPLSALGVGAGLVTAIYKFGLSDPYVNGAPQPQNTYYLQNIYFS